MSKPLAIDLYCGLGGWTQPLLDEGWDVIGFDIEQHVYGEDRYPGLLVIQDVRTLHGFQFKDADLIVGSSPCQEFSYRAMPWKRAKALPPPYLGMELYHAQFRIQQECSEAAGRHVPMIVENVRGAQAYVGRSNWNYGSYHLWGDIPALMPRHGLDAIKVKSTLLEGAGLERRTALGNGARCESRTVAEEVAMSKAGWFNDKPRTKDSISSSGSGSAKRKMSSAKIAKIPYALARHIARVYKPRIEESA